MVRGIPRNACFESFRVSGGLIELESDNTRAARKPRPNVAFIRYSLLLYIFITETLLALGN